MQLLHADWSVAANKRWVAAAERIEGRWRIFDVRKVGTTADFVRSLISAGQVEPVVAGFGEDAAGEDRFDAFMGLLGMIEVVEGRRADSPSLSLEIARWEGWILGQLDAPPARGSPSSADATEGTVDIRLLEAVLATNSATRAALSEILLRDRD